MKNSKTEVDLATAEVFKRVTIDYELQIDAIRCAHQKQLNEKDNLIDRLKLEAMEREAQFAVIRREQVYYNKQYV